MIRSLSLTATTCGLQQMLTRLTLLLLFLSGVLWLLSNYTVTLCDPVDQDKSVAAPDPPEAIDTPLHDIEEISKWLKSNIPKEFSLTESSCHSFQQEPTSDQVGVATLTVLGALDMNHTVLAGVSDAALNKLLPEQYLQLLNTRSNIVLSNLVSAVHSDAGTVTKILKAAQLNGLSLLSLANQHIHDEKVPNAGDAASVCEDANIRWVGLNAKTHEVLKINGVKIGLLAFCGLYAACMEATSQPFTPTKYSTKAATVAVQELQQHGVDCIVVIMYWGRDYSYFPDETALYAARHLAELGVNVVVGYHPHMLQDHAYFGNTLVIFSPGYFLSPDQLPHLCWERTPVGDPIENWRYRTNDHCQMIHPALRESVLEREQLTRVHEIVIDTRRSGAIASAMYTTLSLEVDKATGFRSPTASTQLDHDKHKDSSLHWTDMCGDKDSHCLSCEPF